MRIFKLRKNYEKIPIVLILNFFVTADSSGARDHGADTTTAPLHTTAGWNPWEATSTSVSMTTMTPKRPSDGLNLCSVDAHCENGGKCGEYCPLIEGLGVWCPFEKICYCTPGWYGIECKDTKPTCNEAYCALNGGRCNDLDFLQFTGCDCTGTGKHGPLCELNDCGSDTDCKHNTCKPNMEKPNSPYCDCGAGYRGDKCEIDLCNELINPCVNGNCTHSTDYPYRMECVCDPNWTGPYCDQEIDKCGNGYIGSDCERSLCFTDKTCYHGICKNEVDYPYDIYCDCGNTGYTGENCDIECLNGQYDSTLLECVCDPGLHGPRCNSKCDDTNCLHGGCVDRCVHYDDLDKECTWDHICVCDDGWFGQYCSTPSQCIESECKNGAKCDPHDWLFNECSCLGTGHHGSKCELSDCDPNPCVNGKCNFNPNKVNEPFCDCGVGFNGTACEITVCDTNKGKACKHGGVCMNEDVWPFEMYCDCTGTGYHGDLCEINDCIKCNGNQTCADIDLLVPNNATCECKDGYEMMNGICEWKCFNYCENSGSCFIALQQPFCNCDNTGYHGDQCEIRDCSRPETCLNGECQLDSTCQCFDGWSGDRCDFNICDMVECPEFSTCRISTIDPKGYTCECRKGFSQTPFGCMSKCVFPEPHCERGDCSLNYGGEPVCRCHGTGYHGPQCNLKDCDEDSNAEALCQSMNLDYKCVTNINNPDALTCACKWDECDCKPSMCSNGGKCIKRSFVDREPIFECECLPGYYGDKCQHSCNEISCLHEGRCEVTSVSNTRKMCKCRYGYSGWSCEFKDSCQKPESRCLNNGNCTDSGNFCDCTDHFYGTFCENKNACFNTLCENDQTCVISENSTERYSCKNSNSTLKNFVIYIVLLIIIQ